VVDDVGAADDRDDQRRLGRDGRESVAEGAVRTRTAR
jgi:hypothetical protein